MESYRLKEEYEQLCEQLNTVITEVEALLAEADIANELQPSEGLGEQEEALLKEADIPNEPQALDLGEQEEALLKEADIRNQSQTLEDLGEQKDTREKLIIQMENVKRKMETRQKQKKEKDKKKIEEAKNIMLKIQKEAANVLVKVDSVKNNPKQLLQRMDPKQFEAELKQLKEELGKEETLKLLIKQITQKEMRKKTLQQVGTQFEETEIRKEVENQMADDKLKELLKQVLKDQIPRIQQLSTEELKEPKYTVTHGQQVIVTELIQQLITTKIEPEIEPEIPQAWQQNKDTWIQEQVKEEIKQPIILSIQPLKIKQTRESVTKFVEGLLQLIREPQNKSMVEDTTSTITDVKRFADSIKHQKFRLQQIQERMQQIKEIKKKAEEIQSKACNKKVALDSFQQEVKVLEQRAQQIEWDEYYMKIACLAALRSKDPKTPVSYSTTHWDNIHVLYIITGWCLHC